MFVLPAGDRKRQAGGEQSEKPTAGVQVGVDCLGLEVNVEVRDVLLDESVQLVHAQSCTRGALDGHTAAPPPLA